MSTPFYDQASLVVVPSGYKTSKVYAQKPLTTDGQLTFSRASTATRRTASGTVETVASNVPRLDYAFGETCPKLLLEPQRTNVLLQSNTFSTTWTNSSSSETGGQSGYDGSSDAWLLNKTGANGQVNQSVSSSGINTFSVYAKAGTSNFLRLTPFDDSFFDLANGIAYSSGPTTISANIVSVGNGWYRCSITYNTTSTIVRIIVADSSSSSSGTSGNILIQSAQLETGAYPTSIIPTTTAAVTRLADAASKTGISSLIGSAAGTIYVEFSALANDLTERRIALSDGTTGNVARVGYTNVSNRILAVVFNGANQCVLSYEDADITQTQKVAFTWAANDFALFVNGVKRSTDLSGTTFAANTLTAINFNEGDGAGNNWYGHVDQLLLFKSRLSDSDLAALTA